MVIGTHSRRRGIHVLHTLHIWYWRYHVLYPHENPRYLIAQEIGGGVSLQKSPEAISRMPYVQYLILPLYRERTVPRKVLDRQDSRAGSHGTLRNWEPTSIATQFLVDAQSLVRDRRKAAVLDNRQQIVPGTLSTLGSQAEHTHQPQHHGNGSG